MTEGEALALIRELARRGRLAPQLHCTKRMAQRRLGERDLRHGLATATTLRRSDSDQRSEWTVKARDRSGDPFIVGVSIDTAPPGWLEAITVHDDDGHDDGTKGWITP